MGDVKYPWRGSYLKASRHVEDDRATLSAWLARKITTKEAAKRIAYSNCAPILSEETFVKVVGELGWKRHES